jgi:hypothetical protein
MLVAVGKTTSGLSADEELEMFVEESFITLLFILHSHQHVTSLPILLGIHVWLLS